MMWVIVALLVLSFLIFFHELGHFLVARLFGVKVEVFSIGFGKKVLYKTYGQTQYAISIIPLGGYVKLKGQNDVNPLIVNDDTDSYSNKNHFQKISILLAGPFFNLVLACAIYMYVGMVGQNVLLPTVGKVLPDMPALHSGILEGDKIVYIEDRFVRTWQEVNEAIMNSKSKSIKVKFIRDGVLSETIVLPKMEKSTNVFGEKIQRKFIGIVAKGEVGIVEYSLSETVIRALKETYRSSKMILQAFGKIVSGVVPATDVSGVIGIVDFLSQASQTSFIALLTLTALISVNLGVLNLLPIPALDGGQILFNLYEVVFRRKISEKSLYVLTIFGWVLLVGLMGLGTYNDIHRLATSN